MLEQGQAPGRGITQPLQQAETEQHGEARHWILVDCDTVLVLLWTYKLWIHVTPGHPSCLKIDDILTTNLVPINWQMDKKIEWMNGVLGHNSVLLRLYRAGDNLGKWDEFCYE